MSYWAGLGNTTLQQQVDAGVKTMLSIAYNLLARQKRGFGLWRLPALHEDNHDEEEEVRQVQLLPHLKTIA
jgi:hypothetical protein